MTGDELIAAERKRQTEVEGYTPEHDDAYFCGELAYAAACYATPPGQSTDNEIDSQLWPNGWEKKTSRAIESANSLSQAPLSLLKSTV